MAVARHEGERLSARGKEPLRRPQALGEGCADDNGEGPLVLLQHDAKAKVVTPVRRRQAADRQPPGGSRHEPPRPTRCTAAQPLAPIRHLSEERPVRTHGEEPMRRIRVGGESRTSWLVLTLGRARERTTGSELFDVNNSDPFFALTPFSLSRSCSSHGGASASPSTFSDNLRYYFVHLRNSLWKHGDVVLNEVDRASLRQTPNRARTASRDSIFEPAF